MEGAMKKKNLIPQEVIISKIFLIRGQKVMIDRDLAELYGVETKYLNRQVKRNKERFNKRFMFQLNQDEKNELVTKCHRLESLKHSRTLPYAFTEHGALMASNIIKNPLAIEISILIIDGFVKIREMFATNKEVRQIIKTLEEKYLKQDLINEKVGNQIKVLFEYIQHLIIQEKKPKRRIGFTYPKEKK